MRTHGRRLVALAAVLALTLGACGGGDVQGDEAADPTTTAAEMDNHDDSGTATSHEDEADHQDEVSHEDEATHEDEAMHEDEADHEVTEADRVIEVEMTEFAFSPASVELTAGETVMFILTNGGLVDHEFRLSNDHRIEEHMAAGHEDHGDEGGHHDEGGDLYIQIAPGEKGELTFTVPHDMTLYTDIGCLIPGHYEAGMAGEVVYTDA